MVFPAWSVGYQKYSHCSRCGEFFGTVGGISRNHSGYLFTVSASDTWVSPTFLSSTMVANCLALFFNVPTADLLCIMKSCDWLEVDVLVNVDGILVFGKFSWRIIQGSTNDYFNARPRSVVDRSQSRIHFMMTSSNGNIFRVTGPLCGEFTGNRWIPRTKASDAELWYFIWSAPVPTIE